MTEGTKRDAVHGRPVSGLRLGLRVATLSTAVAVTLWVLPTLRCRMLPVEGVDLNRHAWEQSYVERGSTPPASGPREGYWGARLGPKAFDRQTGWREHPVDEPGLVEIDDAGLQRWTPRVASRHRVLFVGGSVAFGAYASSIERSYFAEVGRALEEAGEPAEVVVLAAGAWWSANELAALRARGLDECPDVVVFLDGLNDLSERRRLPVARRVEDYLRNMASARDLALEAGADVVFAPQPLILDKIHLTPIERRIVCLSCDPGLPRGALARSYRRIRSELAGLADGREGVHLVDASRSFAAIDPTTFADLWHFGDAGHGALAATLTPGLLDVLRSRRTREPDQGASGAPADASAGLSTAEDPADASALARAIEASARRA